MPGLAFGQGGFGFAQRDHFFVRQKILQETGSVVAAAPLVIAPQRFRDESRLELRRTIYRELFIEIRRYDKMH